ncbi:MAG: hypothetical protein GY771_03375 [bacterium]|nr:hypothetical protein [bacterium]
MESGNDLTVREYGEYAPSNYHTFLRMRYNLFDGSDRDDALTVPHNYRDGLMSLGCNLRVAYMFYKGLNFEDSTIISQRLLDEDVLNTLHVHRLKVPVFQTTQGPEKVTRQVIDSFKYDMSMLDARGIINKGSFVRAGGILVSKIRPIVINQDVPEKLLLKMLGTPEYQVKNNFYYLPNELDGAVVLDVNIIMGSGKSILMSRYMKDVIDGIDRRQREISIRLINRYISSDLDEGLLEGCCRYLEGQPNEIKDPYTLASLNVLKRRSAQIYQYFYNKKMGLQLSYSQSDHLYLIEILLMRDRGIKVGDKLTGLHGNKSVVSRIIPIESMPFDSEGRAVDIILSPLSVYGRLNYSQILESKMGMISSSTTE